MAEASVSRSTSGSDSDFNIVLFNTDSSDAEVKAADRQDCMRHVLKSVVKCQDPLFVLCQDKINGPKHKILCDKLGQDPKHFGVRAQAGVYHRPGGKYAISYVDVKTLQLVNDGMRLDADNAFTTARLMACVLSSPPDGGGGGLEKVLLVSWHGPYKISEDRKEACLGRLVLFLERLRKRESCQAVILGGDFNLDEKAARTYLTQEKIVKDSAVLADYEPTKDREELEIVDYIVCWPRGMFCNIDTSVILRDYRREKESRPFDHPIISYRIGDALFRRGKRERDQLPQGSTVGKPEEQGKPTLVPQNSKPETAVEEVGKGGDQHPQSSTLGKPEE